MTSRIHQVTLALAMTLLALLALASVAAAGTTRLYQGSLGSLPDSSFWTVQSVAVDQSSGDVYVYDSGGVVSRFTAAGAPHNFSSSGTNTLTGFTAGLGRRGAGIAIDNSGGPLNGYIYVADAGANDASVRSIKIFDSTGTSRGSLSGSGTQNGKFGALAGVAVDQSNGNVYVSEASSAQFVWRFAPSSPNVPIDDSDYTLVGGISVSSPTSLAADNGDVYVVVGGGGSGAPGTLRRYAASSFAANAPQVSGTEILGGVKAVAVDRGTGDVYADGGRSISVLDAAGTPLYQFGAGGYFGSQSTGVAVKSAASGPAEKAYVVDPQPGGNQVDAFGPVSLAPHFSHAEVASFGKDGTGSSRFSFNNPGQLAFDQVARKLYAIDDVGGPGIYGFDASAPPAYPLLPAFAPLGSAAVSANSGLAVDSTALGSAGNLYLSSSSTNLLYGWSPLGSPLGGVFPVDPEASPGPPDGSPKNLRGAAVDSGGNVWVANSAAKRILKYSSAGASLAGTVDTSPQGRPSSLAFDANNDLYVVIENNGVWRYTASSGYTAAVRIAAGQPTGIAVDTLTHRLFVAYRSGACGLCNTPISWIDEYDNAGNLLDEFADDSPVARFLGVAVDTTSHDVYVSDGEGRKIRVFSPGVLYPEVATRPASGLTNAAATLNGTVATQGVALSDCHFEYVSEAAFEATGFSDLDSGGSSACSPSYGSIPLDLEDHLVSATASGLSRDTKYRFRLSAANANGVIKSADAGFATTGPPIVETVGSQVRTATTIQLSGRIDPVRDATTYHFEYGTEGSCDSNPCTSTADKPAGSGNLVQLVSEPIEGLTADTAYHYRVIADNGNPDGPAIGNDMTVRTRASDAPLTHGHLPGPAGSDRAWEQVSLPNSGGNPVGLSIAFSDNGSRAVYGIIGGTPLSESGGLLSIYFSERTAAGWQTKLITPPRSELVGALWQSSFGGPGDLSSLIGANFAVGQNRPVVWRLGADGPPSKLFQTVSPQEFLAREIAVSVNETTTVVRIKGGTLDPDYPTATAAYNLYDVSSNPPRLLSLLPGNAVAACDVGDVSKPGMQMVSADGSLVFFTSRADNCGGPAQLYLRDVHAEETELISGPPLSGPVCGATLIKAVSDAVFFSTSSRLDPGDAASGSCGDGNDVYRYDLASTTYRCLTCGVAGANPGEALVSADGSRLYFTASKALLPGAATGGTYRLDIASGNLAYVSAASLAGARITPDGSQLLFSSAAAALNPLGGVSNGATSQFYLYDDRDRSLSCVSCPEDGSAPLASASSVAASNAEGLNTDPLADDGTLAFTTPTPLVAADQNTPVSGGGVEAGADVYEWRDGRQLLVSDGLTNWPSGFAPEVRGISPSGQDVYFTAAAQYTPDALDSYRRLYDARIGGGIDFPTPPQPCPLEVCQGTPKGMPSIPPPGTVTAVGTGNQTPHFAGKCPKGKVRRKGRCAAKKHRRAHRRAAHHSRRTPR